MLFLNIHLYYLCFRSQIQQTIVKANVKEFTTCVFFYEFYGFKCLVHFELMFVNVLRYWSSFILSHVTVQFFQHFCWRDCCFLSVHSWPLCHKWIDHTWMGLFLGSIFCCIGLCVCFYANTIMLWILYLCSSLKLGIMIPPALLNLYQDYFGYLQSLLVLYKF